jgi:hypothetical protein
MWKTFKRFYEFTLETINLKISLDAHWIPYRWFELVDFNGSYSFSLMLKRGTECNSLDVGYMWILNCDNFWRYCIPLSRCF